MKIIICPDCGEIIVYNDNKTQLFCHNCGRELGNKLLFYMKGANND